MNLTEEWLGLVEATPDEELASSPFCRLSWEHLPCGVLPTEQVIRQVVRIGKAIGIPDDDEQMIEMQTWLELRAKLDEVPECTHSICQGGPCQHPDVGQGGA